MRTLAVGVMLLLSAMVPAQQLKLVTRATPPPREALDRLSMVQAWHARVPVHGQRDGTFSVQIIPGPRVQLIVQTYGGLVALLDGESGDVLWRTQVGIPGWISQPAGANDNSIFVTRRHELHVLNRRTGYERVYTVEKTTKQVTYGMPVLALPSAEPVADDERVYLSLANRVVAYALPLFEVAPKKVETAGAVVKEEGAGPPPEKPEVKPPVKPAPVKEEPIRPYESSLRPAFAWSYSVGDEAMQQPPLLGGNQVGVITTAGTITSLNRFQGKWRFEHPLRAHVSRAAGLHGTIAYVGTDDTYVYAINLDNDRLLWRHLGGATLSHRPAVTDQDVFVTPGREGLFRLQRETGRELWRSRGVDRFLSVNQRFVYATDVRGQLHVLDGLRGTSMATYDLKDWNIPIPNELTDRIYLASRDGQVLCLRHRDNPTPWLARRRDTPKKVAPKEPEEKKNDENKDAAAPGQRRPALGYQAPELWQAQGWMPLARL